MNRFEIICATQLLIMNFDWLEGCDSYCEIQCSAPPMQQLPTRRVVVTGLGMVSNDIQSGYQDGQVLNRTKKMTLLDYISA